MRVKVAPLPWLSTSMRPGSTGRIHLEHQLAGTTLRDLLQELAERDSDFARLVYDRAAGELRYPALAVVNDQLLESYKGPDTSLSEGDTVSFMAAYVGG